jgi:type IV secretion system protein VirD4
MSQRADDASAGLEAALLAAVVVLGGSAIAAWAGAELAALLFGSHTRAGGSFADAVKAVPSLVTRPAQPRAAWPIDVAARLPGPVGYWIATAPVVACGLVAVGATVWLTTRHKVGLARRRRMGLDPEPRFARPVDLLPLWVRGPTPGRIVLGHLGGHGLPNIRSRPSGRMIATEDPRQPLDPAVPTPLRRLARRRRGPRSSVVVLGPSQCGKTAALAIPAILEWAGPVIALSVKSDLMSATIASRRRMGDVRVFDPVDVTAEMSDTWSPLREATTLTGARRAARSIANSTDWTSRSGEMGFWTAAGEDLLAGLFWAAARCGLGIDTVVRWVVAMEQGEVRKLLGPLAAHQDKAVSTQGNQVLQAFDGVWRSDYRQISSVYLTARQMIRPWQEPAVEASARTPRIDLGWLLDRSPLPPAGRPRANTLYLCADLDEAQRLAPVLGGLVDDLMKQAYARVGKSDTPLDPPLLVVIDEAGNWPMRNLPGRISTCAGLGIQLMLVYQSKAQVDAVYGPRADVILANATTKVLFAGLSDESTLRYAASLLGSEHVRQRSMSTDLGGILTAGGRRNVSEAPTRTDLLPSPMLRQVAPGEALLVYGTLPPAHVRGRYWFLDPDLHERATGVRMSRRALLRRSVRGPNGEALSVEAGERR